MPWLADVRQSMFVLLGAVGLVLLIVCVNVASLVLIRAVGRGREMAVRVAVGAGRVSLVRGLLVESLVLGVGGRRWRTDPGVLGHDRDRLARSVDRGAAAQSDAPRLRRWSGSRSASPMLASVVFGTMPAWQATSIGDMVMRIREEGGSTTSDPKRQRLRSVLIVAETTLAVVLLVGAGLLARSFDRLLSVDLGFCSRCGADLHARCRTPDTHADAAAGIRRHLLVDGGADPDVESAGAIFGLPLSNFRYGISTSTLDGVTLSDEEQDRLTLQVRVVTPDYFKTMRIPVTRGRGSPMPIVWARNPSRC